MNEDNTRSSTPVKDPNPQLLHKQQVLVQQQISQQQRLKQQQLSPKVELLMIPIITPLVEHYLSKGINSCERQANE